MSTIDFGGGIGCSDARISSSTRPHSGAPPRSRLLNRIVFVVADFVAAWLCASIVLLFRFGKGAIDYGTSLTKNAEFLFLFSVLVVLFCNTQKLYGEVQAQTRSRKYLAICRGVMFATLVLLATLYLSKSTIVSRIAVMLTVMLTTVALIGWREIRRFYVSKTVEVGQDCRNVLIIGSSDVGRLLERHLTRNKQLGYVVKRTIERGRVTVNSYRSPESTEEQIEELRDILRANFIDEVFVALPERRDLVKDVIVQAREFGVGVRIIPDMYDGLGWGSPIEHLGPFPMMQIHEEPIPAFSLFLKRAIDVIFSFCALVVIAPVALLITILIRLDSPGPILYSSKRVGKKGRIFTCYKFRTMVQDAEELREKLLHLNERDGLLFKLSADPRITPIGRILRKYSFDELPQLLNVLKGDMSLVGPRPPIPGEVEQYELDHLKRLEVTPGITGLWQVEARRDPSFDSYINLDSHYVDHWSIWLDLKILVKTIGVVVAGTGQ